MNTLLVLTTRPGSRALDRSILGALAAHGAPPPRWLCDYEALEVPDFADSAAFIASIASAPVDCNFISGLNRKKRLLVSDMDSTMIREECIDELGEAAGMGQAIRAITMRAMAGELDFEASLIARVALLKNLPTSVIASILATRIHYMPGGGTLVATMKAHGAFTALVSGGFHAFADPIGAHIGFDLVQANHLFADGDSLTGDVSRPILGSESKRDILDALSTEHGLGRADTLAVGDGANDAAMIQAAGLGVAFHAKPLLQSLADARINHGDLTALLYLQGYSSDEFVLA